MESKFYIYGHGNSSTDVLDKLPRDFLRNAYEAAFLFPTIIPVSSEYGDMMDSHDRYETSPHPNDRLFVYVKMPLNDKTMWTTYCHIIAEHSARLSMPMLDIYCDDENVYFVIYQENFDPNTTEKVKKGIKYFGGYLAGIRKATVEMHNQDICEILKDYIYHIRGQYLDNEPSDFRHTFVDWHLICPTNIYEEDEMFKDIMNIFSAMEKYKYGQYSSKDSRLREIYHMCVPHENMEETFNGYVDHIREVFSATQEEATRKGVELANGGLDTHESIKDFMNKHSLEVNARLEAHLARTYGFIWFISESENNPYGFTLEESAHLKKLIYDNQPSTCIPVVECTVKDVKRKDQPCMIMTIGSTLSNIEGALADSSDEIITNLTRKIYNYINGIEEE